MSQDLFIAQDLETLERRGISVEEATRQVNDIKQGFPYLDILNTASLSNGIMRIDKEEEARYMEVWEDYLRRDTASVYKMVPASGAASRMFKMLYNFLKADYSEPRTEAEQLFFDRLPDFAFYDRLNEVCLRNNWKTIPKLIALKEYKIVVENLLLEQGLNYGSLPKGLLLFHTYSKGACVAADEHLVEGALYARDSRGRVHIHFTVSPEHRAAFEAHIEHSRKYYTSKYSVIYDISYSEQKPSTDTLALTPEGELFRDEAGALVFRPGGHGSLISNLNDLDADIVFIKNIDNVVPDYFKGTTILTKKLLAGILVAVRDQIHSYLKQIERGKVYHAQMLEMVSFLKDNLCIIAPEEVLADDKELQNWLINKLNRPIRVCGMVRNEGEPGGGPFVVREPDGSTSLQILESSQINMLDDYQCSLQESGEYFNPVDLVCAIKDYRGEAFDLEKFVNPKTAFIAHKSQGARELLALERPGLWNGSMHHWNTIFVEVPIETFNPVKEVNDLLRPQHQNPIHN